MRINNALLALISFTQFLLRCFRSTNNKVLFLKSVLKIKGSYAFGVTSAAFAPLSRGWDCCVAQLGTQSLPTGQPPDRFSRCTASVWPNL